MTSLNIRNTKQLLHRNTSAHYFADMHYGKQQQMSSVGFLSKKLETLTRFSYKIKMFVVISIARAYDELEVSNFQAVVDMCQCTVFDKKSDKVV